MGKLIKNILGILEHLFGFSMARREGLYVVNYHGTPQNLIPNVEKHLAYYNRHFKIIGPTEFEGIYQNKKNQGNGKPSMLLTFDDGMKNNIHVMRLLEKWGIKAYFFIIPAFIDAVQPENYLATVIRPSYTNKLEKAAEDFQPMGWEALSQALHAGHRIGSHTLTHSLLHTDDDQKSRQEIASSREILEKRLLTRISSFCSINNTLISIGKVQDELIRTLYDYHFTTYYGNNSTLDPYRIERINIEAYWNMNEVRYALGNLRKSLRNK